MLLVLAGIIDAFLPQIWEYGVKSLAKRVFYLAPGLLLLFVNWQLAITALFCAALVNSPHEKSFESNLKRGGWLETIFILVGFFCWVSLFVLAAVYDWNFWIQKEFEVSSRNLLPEAIFMPMDSLKPVIFRYFSTFSFKMLPYFSVCGLFIGAILFFVLGGGDKSQEKPRADLPVFLKYSLAPTIFTVPVCYFDPSLPTMSSDFRLTELGIHFLPTHLLLFLFLACCILMMKVLGGKYKQEKEVA